MQQFVDDNLHPKTRWLTQQVRAKSQTAYRGATCPLPLHGTYVNLFRRHPDLLCPIEHFRLKYIHGHDFLPRATIQTRYLCSY